MARQQPMRAMAHMFAFAEPLSQDGRLPLSLPGSVWLSRAATMAETFAIPFAFYFKPVVVFIAMFWLFYRAYQVLNKPLEELAALLGFDIPSCPIIDLAAIKADGAIVHWSLAEKQKHKSTHKFEVHLNGNLIETLPVHESAATITGLKPGHYYVVRVSLVNSMEFSSKSAPIRFRTKAAAATAGDRFAAPVESHETDPDGNPEPVPRVRAYRGLKDVTSPPPDAAPMTREGSTGLGLATKQSLKSRRTSPSALELERRISAFEDSEATEGAETVTQLTEKLDTIRRETEETERQAKEEEEEESQQKEELVKERDELRAEAAEKERVSRNLKKELKTLEGQNTNAQNERSKQERLLAQKKQEREKLKENMAKWEGEAERLKEALRRARQEKENAITIHDGDKDAFHVKQEEEAAAIKVLDDELRQKIMEIKELQRALKNNSPSGTEPEPNLVQQLQQDAEEKRQWDLHYKTLQTQYSVTAQTLEKTKRIYAEQQAYLDSLRAKRRQEEAQHFTSAPTTTDRTIRRGDSQRSRRATSGQSASESPRMSNFALTSAPFAQNVTSTAPIFAGNQHINFYNGMTINRPTDELAMSAEDRDGLTGGAPMSPSAGADLLPTDLFIDDPQPLPGLGALPGMPNLAGPLARLDDTNSLVPASPVSGDSSSRSASVFASPQVSQPNLHIGSPEAGLIDVDGRSIRSTRSNRATSGGAAGSRFSGMFGIKQRAKAASTDEGPALSKANSLPRQDGGIPGLDSVSRKRNSSISGSMLSGTLGDAFDAPQMPPASRLSRFNPFSSRAPANASAAWPTSIGAFGRRPGSPRPGSTHSNEFPRPSFDSSRWGADAWPSGDAAGGARSSPLAFGAGWNAPTAQQPRTWGSRHPSRRPSAQQGVSGPPDDIMEDEGSDSDSDFLDSSKAAKLGPIGTRPPAGSKKAEKAPEIDPPRLNPAAKDFKSFFSGMSLTKSKTKDKDNASTVASSASGTPNLAQHEDHDDLSPPNSRKSKDTRDTRSMTTTESSIAESGRNSQEYLARTPSYTNSDAAAPSPLLSGTSAGKESFMQKLSRKSSSSKFTLPTFKREKSRLDTNVAPTSVPTAEEDEQSTENEGPLSASLSSERFVPGRESRENVRGGASGRNWSHVLKLGMGGKKGNETPSLSGMSVTSAGTGADVTTDDEGTHVAAIGAGSARDE